MNNKKIFTTTVYKKYLSSKNRTMNYKVKIYPSQNIPKNILDYYNIVLAQAVKCYGENKRLSDFLASFLSQIVDIRERKSDSYLVALLKDKTFMGGIVLFLDTGFEQGFVNTIIDLPSPGFDQVTQVDKNLEVLPFVMPAIVNFLKEKGYNKIHANLSNKNKLLLNYDFVYPPDLKEGEPHWGGLIKYL